MLAPHSAKSYNNSRKEPLLPVAFHIAAKGNIRASGNGREKIEKCARQRIFQSEFATLRHGGKNGMRIPEEIMMDEAKKIDEE